MDDILQDLSTQSLIFAIENNIISLMEFFHKWPRVEVHDAATLKWFISNIPFPLFNSILFAQLAPDQVDATIEALIDKARQRGVPLLWWITPSTLPLDLVSHLERYGFKGEQPMPGMGVDLAILDEHPSMPPGFVVQKVADETDFKIYIQVFLEGFEMPEFVGDAFFELFGHIDSPSVHSYLGWLNGKPVATSMLLLAAGVAGIFNVATIPEARRKGIGALMTARPLLETRAMGYRVGTLGASEMGFSVYRSLGFQEYCKIGQYVWLPEQDSSGE